MIQHLLLKPARGAKMRCQESLCLTPNGIAGAAPSAPLRQVLLLPASTLAEFSLAPGDLRENVVLDDRDLGGLHQLPSGTVLELGDASVRLTFHCEPCGRVRPFVPRIARIAHRRGYLASVLRPGIVHIGDRLASLGQLHEMIPYDVRERIVWYLAKQRAPTPVATLVTEVGLSPAYCRAIPGLLKDAPEALRMVAFGVASVSRSSSPNLSFSFAEQPEASLEHSSARPDDSYDS